jgi:hypothetical protein
LSGEVLPPLVCLIQWDLKTSSMSAPRPNWGCCNTAKKRGAKECGRQGIRTEFGLGYISENGHSENREIGR